MKFDVRCYRDGNNHTTLRTSLTSIGYRHDGVCRTVSLYSCPIPMHTEAASFVLREVASSLDPSLLYASLSETD
ncbi:hypothetical protein ALC62_09547 [Cyphomyrmex costatus]|uniref:Uncharacterized protein n=1 Tax=Cyphomyrmex costatus TaxID=456900 RepID=A0A195CGR7_9HYME|nr:hypothetical protein ALC62_09547 [Cyphomyrmex costatus]